MRFIIDMAVCMRIVDVVHNVLRDLNEVFRVVAPVSVVSFNVSVESEDLLRAPKRMCCLKGFDVVRFIDLWVVESESVLVHCIDHSVYCSLDFLDISLPALRDFVDRVRHVFCGACCVLIDKKRGQAALCSLRCRPVRISFRNSLPPWIEGERREQ